MAAPAAPAAAAAAAVPNPSESTFVTRLNKSAPYIAGGLALIAGFALFAIIGSHTGDWSKFTDGMKNHVVDPILNNDIAIAAAAVVAAVASYYIIKKLAGGADYLLLNNWGSKKVEKASQSLDETMEAISTKLANLEPEFYKTKVEDEMNPTFRERLAQNKGKIILASLIAVAALGFAGYLGTHDFGMKDFWNNKVMPDWVNPLMDNKLYVALGGIAGAAITYYVLNKLEYITCNNALTNYISQESEVAK